MNQEKWPIILAEYEPHQQGMVSAQGRDTQPIYHVYVGKSGKRWLVPTNIPNPADHIIVEGGPKSDGYGGATLTFKLDDGTTLDLTGPWHSNSNALLNDTGLDIRHKHRGTVGVALGLRRDPAGHGTRNFYPTYTDLVYLEEDTVGRFAGDVLNKVGQEIANDLGETVYGFSQSTGGGSCKAFQPKNK